MTDVPDTLLVIAELGVPIYSARGLTQTLTPITAASQFVRDADGDMMDLSYEAFRKYASKISSSDQTDVPALDGVWPGQILTIDCIVELAYLTLGGSPARTVVPGSDYVSGDHTVYRPRITFIVLAFNQQFDEWPATVGWSLDLEETSA